MQLLFKLTCLITDKSPQPLAASGNTNKNLRRQMLLFQAMLEKSTWRKGEQKGKEEH